MVMKNFAFELASHYKRWASMFVPGFRVGAAIMRAREISNAHAAIFDLSDMKLHSDMNVV